MTKLKAQPIQKLISENISDPNFSVERLAEKLDTSLSHLRETVSSLFDMNPQRLIESVRLEKALQLLSENKSLRFAREKTGFTNARTFRRVFKKRLAITPLACQDFFSQAATRQKLLQVLSECLWQQP